MKKHTMLNMDERLVNLMRKVAHRMGMNLSEWIAYIARDKISYFLSNADKYMLPPDNDNFNDYIKWQHDIDETIEIAKNLWHI